MRMLHIFTSDTEISPHLPIPSHLFTGVIDRQLGGRNSYSLDMDLSWIRLALMKLVTPIL